ncbi:hypothetical protein ACSHWJ_14175 [Methylococcus sp. S1M]
MTSSFFLLHPWSSRLSHTFPFIYLTLTHDRPAGSALTIEPCYDRRIERDVKVYFDRFYSLSLDHFTVGGVAFEREDAERFRSIRAA